MLDSTTHTTARGQLRLNEPLADYTSWHVGGSAKRLYKPADLADLAVFCAVLRVQTCVTSDLLSFVPEYYCQTLYFHLQ